MVVHQPALLSAVHFTRCSINNTRLHQVIISLVWLFSFKPNFLNDPHSSPLASPHHFPWLVQLYLGTNRQHKVTLSLSHNCEQ